MQRILKSYAGYALSLAALMAGLALVTKPSLTAPAPTPDNLQITAAGATFPST
ncbi:MAG TPA: hypothetical protein VG028_03870 [Terriglobia bacterium]|nr:hypothetical protein [Terriglobia bacterium]